VGSPDIAEKKTETLACADSWSGVVVGCGLDAGAQSPKCCPYALKCKKTEFDDEKNTHVHTVFPLW